MYIQKCVEIERIHIRRVPPEQYYLHRSTSRSRSLIYIFPASLAASRRTRERHQHFLFPGKKKKLLNILPASFSLSLTRSLSPFTCWLEMDGGRTILQHFFLTTGSSRRSDNFADSAHMKSTTRTLGIDQSLTTSKLQSKCEKI